MKMVQPADLMPLTNRDKDKRLARLTPLIFNTKDEESNSFQVVHYLVIWREKSSRGSEKRENIPPWSSTIPDNHSAQPNAPPVQFMSKCGNIHRTNACSGVDGEGGGGPGGLTQHPAVRYFPHKDIRNRIAGEVAAGYEQGL